MMPAAGTRHHSAKLNVEAVQMIRALLRAGQRPAAIARDFDVSVNAIKQIRDGRSWAWLK